MPSSTTTTAPHSSLRVHATIKHRPLGATTRVLLLSLVAVALSAGIAVRAQAQEPPVYGPSPDPAAYPRPDMPGYSQPSPPTPPYPAQAYGANHAPQGAENTALIPPNVEGEPYPAQGGGYCYVGPHPVDTRVQPGYSWDATEGQHIRPYPPVDARLFAYQNGCYYFTGDPRDFGYGGQTYAYYGAHPILDIYGGGWCFMMGGHNHLWRPWSASFTVVGPWSYWQGPYDPFFWAYWPYYSFYYRSYYPHYYAGGRFYRGGGYRAAPPIRSVPASAWRGAAPGRAAPVIRGAAPTQMYRSAPPSTMGASGRGWDAGAAPAAAPVARPSFAPGPRPSFSPGPKSSFSPGPRPSFSAPTRSSSSPSRGGGMGSHGSFHGGGRR